MKVKLSLVALALAFSVSYANDGYYNESYENEYAKQNSTVQYVRVTQSRPVYESVVERTPYEECRNIRVPIQNSGVNEGLGTFIGGVAGGILGNQVGGGNGKTVATIGGAILGSAVGNKLSRQNGGVRYENRRECDTRYREVNRRVLKGYENIGYYNGQRIVKFADTKLTSIPVTISISY